MDSEREEDGMKGTYAVFSAIFALALTLAPLGVIGSRTGSRPTGAFPVSEGCFRILRTATGETEQVSEEDYTVGVLAAEMSPEAEPEALKARAVAAYTYACRRRADGNDGALGYDLTDDADSDQAYISKDEQVALWEDSYGCNRELLERAAYEVLGELITFGGRPILAVSHEISSGKTENAYELLEGNYPYLISVESSADLLAPDYLSTEEYDVAEFADMALELGITLVGEAESWLSEPVRSGSGGVVEYLLAGHSVSGLRMKKAFGLKSTSFELAYSRERFTFTVRGIGHGLGMSRFGAEHMASQGNGYREILEWYYPNTVIKKADRLS